MYVVFEDGSKQYRVQEGDVVKVDYRDAEVGSQLEFAHVLLYNSEDDTRIGQPMIDGAKVVGQVVDHPSTKLFIQHFRRRKTYRRLKGHRQPYTAVKIETIDVPGMKRPVQTEAAQPEPVATPEAAGAEAAGAATE